MATLSIKKRVKLINSENPASVIRPISDFRLNQHVKTQKIRFKQVKVRRCWRRPDDHLKHESDK